MKTTIVSRSFLYRLPKENTQEKDVWERIKVDYQLFVDEQGKLVKVKNEYGYDVEESSECFEFFSKNRV